MNRKKKNVVLFIWNNRYQSFWWSSELNRFQEENENNIFYPQFSIEQAKLSLCLHKIKFSFLLIVQYSFTFCANTLNTVSSISSSSGTEWGENLIYFLKRIFDLWKSEIMALEQCYVKWKSLFVETFMANYLKSIYLYQLKSNTWLSHCLFRL